MKKSISLYLDLTEKIIRDFPEVEEISIWGESDSGYLWCTVLGEYIIDEINNDSKTVKDKFRFINTYYEEGDSIVRSFVWSEIYYEMRRSKKTLDFAKKNIPEPAKTYLLEWEKYGEVRPRKVDELHVDNKGS